MKSLGEVLQLSYEHLKGKNVRRSRRVAEELLAAVLECKRLDLYMQFDRPLHEGELERMRAYLKRACLHEPVEYILERHSFYNCSLRLSRGALIPRQETEVLVDKVAGCLKGEDLEGKSALDLCTGSGCIGIALKKQFPTLSLTLSDLSIEALELARLNAGENGTEVEIVHGDLLRGVAGRKFNYLFCNPPYIAEVDFPHLDPSVRDFEPKMALVAGEGGLEFYKRLEKELPPFLEKGAKLFFEIGTGQGAAVAQIFESAPWKRGEVLLDWSGHERFFFLEFE